MTDHRQPLPYFAPKSPGKSLRKRLKRLIRSAPLPIATEATETAPEVLPLIEVGRQLRSLVGKVGRTEKPLDIVFFTAISRISRFFLIEAMTAAALAARGHRVSFILCDRSQQGCVKLTDLDQVDWQTHCHHCWQDGRQPFEALGLPIECLTDLVAESRDLAPPAGVSDFQDAIESSLIRQYGSTRFPEDEKAATRREGFSVVCLEHAKVAELLARRGVDRVIMPDGVYATYAPMLEVLTQRGVPTLVHGLGRRSRCEHFSWNRAHPEWDLEDAWRELQRNPLSETERIEIEAYLEGRKVQKDESAKYSFGEPTAIDDTRRLIGVPEGVALHTLFPNLLWDANTIGRNILFENPEQWIRETVAWYASQPDLFLCLKAHPAETVRGSLQSTARIAADALPEGCANVRIIRADEPIESQSVIDATDLGLVYTTTVGLELAAIRKPAVIAGQVHYRGKGFTSDPATKQDYFELLRQTPGPLSTGQQDLAICYFHLWAIRAQIPFPFFTQGPGGDVTAVEPEDLRDYGSHESFRLVIEGIESQQDILLPRH